MEVLSCRSTREKLLCYFRIRAGEEKSLSFSLPFTLSALAEYLCVDRSAMMGAREAGFKVRKRVWTSLSERRTQVPAGAGKGIPFFFKPDFLCKTISHSLHPQKVREQRVKSPLRFLSEILRNRRGARDLEKAILQGRTQEYSYNVETFPISFLLDRKTMGRRE